MRHRLCGARRDAPARARRRRDDVGVERERRADSVVGGDVRERVARERAHRDAIHAHIDDVIARVRRNGEGEVVAVRHRLCAPRRDTPARARRRRDDVGVERKRRADGVIGGDVEERVARERAL